LSLPTVWTFVQSFCGVASQRWVFAVLEGLEHVEAGGFGGGFGGLMTQFGDREGAGEGSVAAFLVFDGATGDRICGQLDPGDPGGRATGDFGFLMHACHRGDPCALGLLAVHLAQLRLGQGGHDFEYGVAEGAGDIDACGSPAIDRVAEGHPDYPARA
jgi:hypothetical protein